MMHILPNRSRLQPALRLLYMAALASVFPVASVFAQDEANLQARYPAGTVQSMETADRALADVEKKRAAIQAQFGAEERACYEKFFVTSCVDEAKERRRLALTQLRPIEIEANAFKRRARVMDRDKALSDKHAEEERKGSPRSEHGSRAPATENAKTAAQESAPGNAGRAGSGTSERVKQHEARLKRLSEKDRANAQKRADNIAKYEKKVQEAEARQRKVEAKKKEKEKARAESPQAKQ